MTPYEQGKLILSMDKETDCEVANMYRNKMACEKGLKENETQLNRPPERNLSGGEITLLGPTTITPTSTEVPVCYSIGDLYCPNGVIPTTTANASPASTFIFSLNELNSDQFMIDLSGINIPEGDTIKSSSHNNFPVARAFDNNFPLVLQPPDIIFPTASSTQTQAVSVFLDDTDVGVISENDYQLQDISYDYYCLPPEIQDGSSALDQEGPTQINLNGYDSPEFIINFEASSYSSEAGVIIQEGITDSTNSSFDASNQRKGRSRKKTTSIEESKAKLYEMDPKNPPLGVSSRRIRKAIKCHSFQEHRKNIGLLNIKYQDAIDKLKIEIHDTLYGDDGERVEFVKERDFEYFVNIVEKCIMYNKELSEEAMKRRMAIRRKQQMEEARVENLRRKNQEKDELKTRAEKLRCREMEELEVGPRRNQRRCLNEKYLTATDPTPAPLI